MGQKLDLRRKITSLIFIWTLGLSSFTFAQTVSDVNQNSTAVANSTKTNLDKKINDDNFVTNLTALAASVATVGMLLSCKPIETDVYIGAGAGGIWMAGEVMAAMKYRGIAKDLEKNAIDEYSVSKEGNEKQIEVFYKLKASYEQAKSTIESKNKMQKVAVVGYLAAAATAALMAATIIKNTPMVCAVTPTASMQKTNNSVIAFLASKFVTEAKASTSPFWFITGAAAILFTKLVISQKINIPAKAVTPVGRAIMWGAFALLMTMALKASENVIKQIEANITKIDIIIKRLELLQKGGFAEMGREKPYSVYNAKGLKSQIFAVSPDKNKTTLCPTSGAASGACKSLTAAATESKVMSNLPEGFQAIGTSIMKAADGVAGQNSFSDGSLGNINDLASKSGAIGKGLEDKAKELIAIADGKNGTKTDLNKASTDQLNLMKAATVSAVKNSGMALGAANSMLSGFSDMIGNADAGVAGKEEKVVSKSLATNNTSNTVATTNASGLDFKFDPNLVGNVETTGAAGEARTDSLENYKDNFADIHPDSKKNIFDIISGRYLKSGYPRLLEEEL